jgi:hypothetical protein
MDSDVNRQIVASLDLSKNAKSEWVASMGFPSEKVTGLVVQSVKVNGASVSFVAVELTMSKFDLILSAGGTMKGTVTLQQGPLIKVDFKRMGEAKVALIQISPAVSKELEGDWEGTLAASGASFPMIFHFKNQPDRTVSATVDIPVTNAMAIPINDVKQSSVFAFGGNAWPVRNEWPIIIALYSAPALTTVLALAVEPNKLAALQMLWVTILCLACSYAGAAFASRAPPRGKIH